MQRSVVFRRFTNFHQLDLIAATCGSFIPGLDLETVGSWRLSDEADLFSSRPNFSFIFDSRFSIRRKKSSNKINPMRFEQDAGPLTLGKRNLINLRLFAGDLSFDRF